MLRLLRIRDFAVIRDLEVEFGAGLNILTGETGSGKSIIVDALGLLVGERSSQEMIRSDCEKAVLEGQFALDQDPVLFARLEEGGISKEEDLLVRREISSAGRNRIFVNNTLTTLTLLKSIGARLVDIHGQQTHHDLLNLQSHLEFLDRFGGNSEKSALVREIFLRIRELALRLDSTEMDEQERLKRIDMLQYQIEEIRAANVSVHERADLENEKSILSNREDIFARASEVYALLYDSNPSILGLSNRVSRCLQDLQSIDHRWSPHRETLAELLFKLEDLAYFARDYTAGMDFTPGRLDELERRLSELDRLARKYGHSASAILEYLNKCEKELQDYNSYEDTRHVLEAELNAEMGRYRDVAAKLSEKRRRDGRRLEREIKKQLQSLSMEGAELRVRFGPHTQGEASQNIPGDCRLHGVDQVEFFVSPNKGEELKPLAKIASGGELSRISLALKYLCGGGDRATLVFDEVDAGIGGRVAEAVGRRLRDISGEHQVLCVTHLPQIAVFAARHYRVHKDVKDARTVTSVKQLDEAERVQELARMLGGEQITNITLRHAREMLVNSMNPARSEASKTI